MHELLARTIYPRFWKGVQKNHVKVQGDFYPCVFDIETCYGFPFACGFLDGGRLAILHGLRKPHLKWLLDQLLMLDAGRRTIILSGHFISFDLGVLLWPLLNPLGRSHPGPAPRRSHFSLLEPKCTFEIFWGRPCFGRIKLSNEKTVQILDTFSYFSMSLKRALRAIGSNERKLKKPKKLGKRVIPPNELRPYLGADLRGAFALLRRILDYHREYQIRLCVSSPMMAGRIFRHYYMAKDFAKVPKRLLTPALLSYHGGKNSFPGKAGWYKDAWDLDINSAYAEAMRQLPDFENGKWQRGKGERFLRARPHGIYRVSGTARRCSWGLLFDHSFKRIFGPFESVWTTGYELLHGIACGEIEAYDIEGWGFNENRKAKTSAFKRYVDEFYEKKQSATEPGQREFFKHMLTDLYGKFIARIEDDNGDMVAGSMFDPAIASLITGYVRAKIHSLEHRYNALHTATDGFITQERPRQADLGKGIGMLKQETFGPVAILRNKLYLHYSKETGKLAKCGLHGFELGPKKLMKLWTTGKRKYTVEHLVRWKEAWHTGIQPGTPISRKKELHI